MTASWVRRTFDGVGVTQYKPGRHLEAVQAHLMGRALLCIDVSGSMAGAPLQAAIGGGLDFLGEAGAAHYRCGLILWSDTVDVHLGCDATPKAVRSALGSARIYGGTALAPTIRAAIAELGPLTGDRVVCVFSDGDIFDPVPTAVLADQARALGIRFVVRGLGRGASASLTQVLRPEDEGGEATIEKVSDMRRGIASMAAALRKGG